MDFLDELETMATNATWSPDVDEISDQTVERWQSLFGYSAAEARARTVEQREYFTALVSETLWQSVSEYQVSHGHDRESYSHWLRLPHKQSALRSSNGDAPSQTKDTRNVDYLLKMDGPLSTPEVIATVAELNATPKVFIGGSEEDIDNVHFCKVDSAAKQKILSWLDQKHPGYRPLFIVQSIARKDFSSTTLAPMLGHDATLPQNRPTRESFVPRPAVDEYPIWYFFYGTLADPDTLTRLFRQINGGQATRANELNSATVFGGHLTRWADTYNALLDGTSAIAGAAFCVRSREHEDALRSHETSAYEVVRCRMTLHETPKGGPLDVVGCTFRFVAT